MDLDDAAAAALFVLGLEQDPGREHIGALYTAPSGYERTETVTSGQGAHVKGALTKPAGAALAALFHNHPQAGKKDSYYGERFSEDDKAQAKRLGIPSYIATPSGAVRRFTPGGGEAEVLAQFPIAEFRSYLMQKLLDRAPDDPRGLMR